MKVNNTIIDVLLVAKLASLTVTTEQIHIFQHQIASVLTYMSKIQELNTESIDETSQVNGLTNVLRDDVVDNDRMFTQDEALFNAKRVHRGFFVVDAILE